MQSDGNKVPIAIIGMAIRAPPGPNQEEYPSLPYIR